MNNKINVISDNMDSTVVCEYIPLERKDSSFQSEDQLEKELIRTLQEQAYEYINFNSEEELIQNLRNQLEKLNNIKFSQNEWNNIFNSESLDFSPPDNTPTFLNTSSPLNKNAPKRDLNLGISFVSAILSTSSNTVLLSVKVFSLS